MNIKTVCFIGSGTMGCFNALLAAAAGYKAVVYDVSKEALSEAPARLEDLAEYLILQAFFPPHTFPDAFKRIRYSSDLGDAIGDAQLISESVPEQLAIKRAVFTELESLCSEDVLVTTNTSGLLVSDIEDVFVHGHRFAALHSHLGSRLFDIVGGPRTSKDTIATLQAYVKSLGCKPLVLNKEHPGYVINAMIGPLLTTAKVLVIEGIASIEDVDRAWMKEQNANIGPFGLMDLFGINVIHDSWQKQNHRLPGLQEKVLGFISPYIEANKLGAKTGSGFYSYPDPAYTKADFLALGSDVSFAYRVMLNALIESAIVITQNDVATPAAIDEAWCFTMSVANGPFALLEVMGKEKFLSSYRELRAFGFGSEQASVLVDAHLSSA